MWASFYAFCIFIASTDASINRDVDHINNIINVKFYLLLSIHQTTHGVVQGVTSENSNFYRECRGQKRVYFSS